MHYASPRAPRGRTRGDWAGKVNATGIDPDAYPQPMQVDCGRVQRCGAGNAAGMGCATCDPAAEQVALEIPKP
ncbi:hypothetical protein ARC78_05085 [Stenotrophomonas pictorum JCM 9942]|uniref:Uncharacterized protein n=1 Tax=Stenotrophomonas pictorum JCM 9942 TaxID=1236960 RepID=A0A0R0AHA0_9GAMM|nr:hypothetical protein [Stenotrophomonas pictorum]KRG44523.1 hypothetical protein ARC78_05085 [Stenotrophomonas pictorum JCM 9942]